jgi:hypothetical protein
VSTRRHGTARKAARTVLDQLVTDGIILAMDATDLRRIANPNRKPAPISIAESATMQSLLRSLLKPASARGRRAQERAFAMAYECLYYKSLGNSDATAKTAKRWKVTPRTIINAMDRHSGMTMTADINRDVDLQQVFAERRKRLSK